jgi:hypothetical protein
MISCFLQYHAVVSKLRVRTLVLEVSNNKLSQTDPCRDRICRHYEGYPNSRTRTRKQCVGRDLEHSGTPISCASAVKHSFPNWQLYRHSSCAVLARKWFRTDWWCGQRKSCICKIFFMGHQRTWTEESRNGSSLEKK